MIFTFIGIVLSVLILMQKNANKIIYFFVAILFIPFTVKFFIVPLPVIKVLLYALLLGFYLQNKNITQMIKKFPLFKSYAFLFGCLILIGVFDNRLEITQKISRPLIYFLENYFLAFLVYYSIQNEKQIKQIYNLLLNAFLIMSIYGLFNFITVSNPFQDYISEIYSTRNIADVYFWRGDRTRISSFVYHPILYGLYLSIVGLYLVFALSEKTTIVGKTNRVTIISLFILVLSNLILTNSRTPQMVFAIGIFIFFGSYIFNRKNFVKLFVILLLFIASFQIPVVSETGTRILDIFTTGGESVEGSSIMMRQRQLLATFVLFNKSPIFGNGFKYIGEDLGWATSEEERGGDTGDLGGFESFLFELLIEQGLIGIVGNTVFFLALVGYHLKNYKFFTERIPKGFVLLNIAIIFGYLAFIVGTGELHSMPFFFIIMGISLKYQQIKLQELSEKNEK